MGGSNNKRNAAKGKNIQQQQQQKAFNILMQVPAKGRGRGGEGVRLGGELPATC